MGTILDTQLKVTPHLNQFEAEIVDHSLPEFNSDHFAMLPEPVKRCLDQDSISTL